MSGVLLTGTAADAAPAPGKIGYLHPTTIDPNHSTLRALSGAWRRLGYVEGQSVLLRTAAGDRPRLPGLAQELVDQGIGVLIVVGAPTLQAAAKATTQVPLVAIDLETDPVRAGYAATVARPGGRVTGLFMDLPALAGKWIELLKEAAPLVSRLALAWDPATSRDQLEVSLEVARKRGLKPVVFEVRSAADYAKAFATFGGEPVGIVQLTTPGSNPWFAGVAAAAIDARLAVVTFQRANARAGALLSYGPVHETYFPRAVELADLILRGARPGELPIEGAANFELAINQATARRLGLSLPQALLARADQVIE